MKKSIKRLLGVPDRSFFLFGPRGTGKSSWLKQVLPEAVYLDLLDASLSLSLSTDPHSLEAVIGAKEQGTWVVLDEVQKVPSLLDEVHRLMESRQWKFALCGSSARKLRRSGANLLAGRALTLNMEPFSFFELAEDYNVNFSMEWGLLPIVRQDPKNAAGILSAYVNTYIKEEIREEGLVRKVAPFMRFLNIAGQLNGQVVNGQNVARDASVSRSNVDVYFSILSDTLLGHFLQAYRPNAKVREATHPKFFWFDSGVARAAAGLSFDPVDRTWKGTALETLLFHELRAYNEISNKHRLLAYYRTASGQEIDFVVETRKRQSGSPAHVVCIEAKLSEKWDRGWEAPMRSLALSSAVVVDAMFGVYMGNRAFSYDRVSVLPLASFLKELHEGRVF